MEITVTLTDGRELVAKPGMREFVAFEREYDVPASEFADGGRLEWLLFIVHKALAKSDDVPDDLDEFLDLVADIDADEEADPTEGEDQAATAA